MIAHDILFRINHCQLKLDWFTMSLPQKRFATNGKALSCFHCTEQNDGFITAIKMVKQHGPQSRAQGKLITTSLKLYKGFVYLVSVCKSSNPTWDKILWSLQKFGQVLSPKPVYSRIVSAWEVNQLPIKYAHIYFLNKK